MVNAMLCVLYHIHTTTPEANSSLSVSLSAVFPHIVGTQRNP